MNYQYKKIILLCAGSMIFGMFSSVHAATLSLTPATSEIGIGDKEIIELKVDSEGTSFNAAQATIRFPKDLLEVVAIDKTESAFSFWLDEPQFSNTDGIISFTGGTRYGVLGGAVSILKIEFRAKSSGNSTLDINEAAVSAADGSGTNVLSKINNAVISIVPQKVTPKIPTPQQIIRTPVISENLPAKPVLKISLYPEEDRWYSMVNPFTARWDLPLDISGINTLLDKSPNSIPLQRSEGLFDNKTFDALREGTWYLHVRFQNNNGWGPTTHYRLAVDTETPLGFKIHVLEGEKTDNPTPTLQFQTSDALSGLKEYQIRIGDGDVIKIPATGFSGDFKLPLQAPGTGKVFVRAIDQAQNGIEDSVNIEILPIVSPIITFAPKELFSDDEQGLVVKGTASPDTNVIIKVQNIVSQGKGEIVAQGTVRPDEKGNWEFTFASQPLRSGQYIILAQSQDVRGALSLTVESTEIQVKSKPILQIGAFQLGATGAILLLLLLLVIGFAGGVWFYKNRQEKLVLRVGFTEAETTKIFKLIAGDVEHLSDALTTPTEGDNEYALKRLRENVKKMGEYLKHGVEKIKR